MSGDTIFTPKKWNEEDRIQGEVNFISGFDENGVILDIFSSTQFNGHPYLIEELFKAIETCSRKNADYTGGEHPLANFLLAEDFGIPPTDGLLLRMLDKIQRIKSFQLHGKLEVANESVEDAFQDLGVYSFLMLVLIRVLKERKDKEQGIPI